MGNYKNGYITVYLSLTIGILLSFIVTIIEGVRIQTIRFQTECVTDIALNSIFAEYNRQVLEQYDLFLIDTSYGHSDPSVERTKSHLLQYMNMNFILPGQDSVNWYKNLTSLHADNASLNKISFVSDSDGETLQYQIIQLMKENSGLSILDDYLSDTDQYKNSESRYDDLNQDRSCNKELINGILEELNSNKKKEENPISISNPADSVENMDNHLILDYALSDINQLSQVTINTNEYISHRQYCEGYGLREEQKHTNNLLTKQLYYKYLFNKCGFYSNCKENSLINYQIEYVITGVGSDQKNLESVAEKIFKIQYISNMSYLFSSSQKQAEAEELALAITTGIMHPELAQAVKISLLFAWGYAESAKDVRILFDGNKIPIVKTNESWNTPLTQLVTFKSHLGEYKLHKNGRDYKDFLYLFLMIEKQEVVNKRFMDIMEMDIRKTEGNNFFKLDYCIYQLEAEINISSKYGYGNKIVRSYSYE